MDNAKIKANALNENENAQINQKNRTTPSGNQLNLNQ